MRAKRLLLTLSLIICSIVATEAQSLHFGVAAATNNSKYRIGGMEDAIENSMGFMTGITAEVDLPLISITPEFWYTQSRFEITDTSILGMSSSVRNHKIEIPVLVGVGVSLLQFEAGPRFIVFDKTTAKLADDSINMDLGAINSSLGYTLGVKASLLKAVTIGARFNGQFNNDSQSFSIGDESYNIKNYSFSIFLGLRL